MPITEFRYRNTAYTYKWPIESNQSIKKEDMFWVNIWSCTCCTCICRGSSHLLVLLCLLPPPPPLQSVSLCSTLHHGVQRFPQHQVPVMEAPHPWSTQRKLTVTEFYNRGQIIQRAALKRTSDFKVFAWATHLKRQRAEGSSHPPWWPEEAASYNWCTWWTTSSADLHTHKNTQRESAIKQRPFK